MINVRAFVGLTAKELEDTINDNWETFYVKYIGETPEGFSLVMLRIKSKAPKEYSSGLFG